MDLPSGDSENRSGSKSLSNLVQAMGERKTTLSLSMTFLTLLLLLMWKTLETITR